MGKFDTYKIPLRALELGEHSFEVHLGRKFFVDIDGEEVKKGELEVQIQVVKSELNFELNFWIDGKVWVPCDRCLDDVEVLIEIEESLIVKYGVEFAEEGDHVIIVPQDEEDINVAWYLYEYVALALPIKNIHGPGKCNKTMTSKLKKHAAHSSDDESDDEFGFEEVDESVVETSQESVDPRWEGLKNLID